jgi:peroxiredoxin
MTIEQTIEIPADRHLRLDLTLPDSFSAGQARIILFDRAGDLCPTCGKTHVPNAETLAAIAEGDAMTRGEIPANRFHSLEDLFASLDS